MTWAVFMDRYNTTWREADGLTQADAEALAARLSVERAWPHWAAPSDVDLSPLAGVTEEDYAAVYHRDEEVRRDD